MHWGGIRTHETDLYQARGQPDTPPGRPVFFFFFRTLFYFAASGQAVVTGVVPPPPRFLPSIFIAHRVQQSYCSSMFHRVLLTQALAFSASQFVRKKKSPRIMHSVGFELTKLTYTRLEDSPIRHRGDRPQYHTLSTVYTVPNTHPLSSMVARVWALRV